MDQTFIKTKTIWPHPISLENSEMHWQSVLFTANCYTQSPTEHNNKKCFSTIRHSLGSIRLTITLHKTQLTLFLFLCHIYLRFQPWQHVYKSALVLRKYHFSSCITSLPQSPSYCPINMRNNWQSSWHSQQPSQQTTGFLLSVALLNVVSFKMCDIIVSLCLKYFSC